ncbi:MAG: NUDIX domain-containing protein, partial [Acidobacteriota bacterium]
KDRFKLISEVHLLLLKDEKVLLLRRFQTGYEDGNYSVVAGHIDGNESARDAMIREAFEEAGLEIQSQSLELAHVMHRKAQDERVSFFFTANRWKGELNNKEPHKCDELDWFPLNALPANMVGYVAYALACFLNGEHYSEYGW